MFVHFTDSEQTAIDTVFAGPQDPEAWQNMGEVEEDDPRYMAFLASLQPSALALAQEKRDQLLDLATLRIAPLQDAVDLDDASAKDIALLKKWKQFRVAVNRLDLTAESIAWPAPPSV